MNNRSDSLMGLTAFIETSFPKKCSACGATFQTATQFLTETQNMPNGRSSLKEALEEDGTEIVEVFRNCACGSTLMDEFNSRRDNSDTGKESRAEFDQLLSNNRHLSIENARSEVLKQIKNK